ncbi:MAG TPA: RluA family pseudouridine synthase [Kofleriaceae bacterium]|jgi:23S rRNA pseudouridine1911/1915/1917 synthase
MPETDETDAPTTVTATEGGRVDKELARHFPDAGRKQLATLFDDGGIKVNGKKAKKGDFISVGDTITVARLPVSGDALRPVPDAALAKTLEVLVERPDLIVINKPAGVPSQPLKAGELGTIANAIAARWPECAQIGDDVRDGGLVHRLDIGTSGVLVAARTEEAYRALRDAFGDGGVAKSYLAITESRPVSREADAPLVQRGKKVIMDHTDGLAAHTAFTVERATTHHALVRCIASTGRMHQVRAHLAHVASPILGDTLYGGSRFADQDGFFLHAETLAVDLPGGRLDVTAPLPDRFTAALAAVGL